MILCYLDGSDKKADKEFELMLGEHTKFINTKGFRKTQDGYYFWENVCKDYPISFNITLDDDLNVIEYALLDENFGQPIFAHEDQNEIIKNIFKRFKEVGNL